MQTALEQLDRMDALVKRLASFDAMSRKGAADLVREAHEMLQARKPQPDPDEEEAKKICNSSPYRLEEAPVITNGHIFRAVLAGIKRGRELKHPDGFDKALAVIKRDVPIMGDDGQRRLARDVLAAIQS